LYCIKDINFFIFIKMKLPSSFIYSISWEDPQYDKPVLNINDNDEVLTITGGGCNIFNMLLDGAKKVYCVDLNPAQNHLFELKQKSIEKLDYENVWKMFGEGKHEKIDNILNDLDMTNDSDLFWNKNKHYFKKGLYFYGSMGKIIYFVSKFNKIIGLHETKDLSEQRDLWWNNIYVCFLRFVMSFNFLVMIFFNKYFFWNFCGVPKKQLNLIKYDNRKINEYLMYVFNNVFTHSHITTENYFYLLCLTGCFTKKCCPLYLQEKEFNDLKPLVNKVNISTDYFINELEKRKYSKVILLDHLDWQDEEYVKKLSKSLYEQTTDNAIIIWRSASKYPYYNFIIQEAGFNVTCENRHHDVELMDRINMYASFWKAVKVN
jgi:betaine lipid synthase